MSEPSSVLSLLTPLEQQRWAKEMIHSYAQTLGNVAERLDAAFSDGINLILNCRGSIIIAGMGKAGLIGQKIAATLSSLGTRSHFLHPAEALHGDLGRIHHDDVVLIFSQSGETPEIVRLLPSLAQLEIPLIAITCRADGSLGRAADVCIDLGPIEEACPLALAPTTSTAAMLAVGDALALVVSRMRGFDAADFARNHPGGSLGFRLSYVEDHMRPLAECRVACDVETVRDVLIRLSRPGRRTGAILLVDDAGKLTGLFTDSDLARLFERRREEALDGPIRDVMTANPKCVAAGTQMLEAVQLLAQYKISELLIVDAERRPVGLIDITDVVAHLPKEAGAVDRSPPPRVRHAA